MKNKAIDYDKYFMDIVDENSKTFLRTFNEDYRLYSLVHSVKLNRGKLLDIGCGGGKLTESLPFYFKNARIYGCDISNTAISYAKKFGSGKVKYSVIKNNKFPYENNSFDVCIAFDVLEHVQNIDYLLNEAKRVLKDNGKFFIIVPCEGQPFTYTWLFQKLHLGQNLTYRYFGHIHSEYTHKYVLEVLKKHGFKIEEISYSEHFFYQCVQVLLLFLSKRFLELLVGEKKIAEYMPCNSIKSPKKKYDIIRIIRMAGLGLYDFFRMYVLYWETIVFRKVSFTGWKLHVLVRKEIKT